MRITVSFNADDSLGDARKAKLPEAAVEKFLDSVSRVDVEYDVNPETGVAVPMKIDGKSILHEPVKGVVPDHLRERMQGTPPDLRSGESM